MGAGSGDGGLSLDDRQDEGRDDGATRRAAGAPVTFGNEQQLQKSQLGEHWPPETSVGQLSSQDASPQIAARPLTSNVSSVRITTRAARRKTPVSHR